MSSFTKKKGKGPLTPNVSTRGSEKKFLRSSPHSKHHVLKDNSQKSPSKKKLDAEMNKLAHDCAYYIILADQKKYPIKKSDIHKIVLKRKEKFNGILKSKVEDILMKAYKFELRDIPKKKDQYILVNVLKFKYDISELNENQLKFRGLLFFILFVIFMGTSFIEEDVLWEALQKFGIDVSLSTHHKVFGDVKKHVSQELVKQMYLESTPMQNSEPPKVKFSWGFRAFQEVDKKDVLDFACQIYGNQREDWISQYREIQREEIIEE